MPETIHGQVDALVTGSDIWIILQLPLSLVVQLGQVHHIRLPASQVTYLPERQALLQSLSALGARFVRAAELPDSDAFLDNLEHNTVLRISKGSENTVFYVGDWDGYATPQGPILVLLVKWLDVYNFDVDDATQPFARPAAQATMLGAYYKETRTIFLAADPNVSIEWLTLSFLHEISHAIDHLRGRKLPHWRSEWRARANAYLAMQAMAGPNLRNGLRDHAALLDRITERLRTGEKLGLFQPDIDDLSEDALDVLWGRRANNSDERAVRRTFTGHALVQEAIAGTVDDDLKRLSVTK